MFKMSRLSGFFLACLLLSLAAAQNTTDCGRSNLPEIASGVINLGTQGVPPATVAQTSYSMPITGLGTFAQVFAAFAIAGFQGGSQQTYFSLVVDQIIFNNGNTRMNFSMIYTNPAGTYQTTWSSIKLSWVAVTTGFQRLLPGAIEGSAIWAGQVGVNTSTVSVASALMSNSIWSRYRNDFTSNGQCGYINTSPPAFDLNCDTGSGGSSFGFTNSQFLAHLYIMGFQFNPAGTYSLGGAVHRNGPLAAALSVVDQAQVTFIQRNLSAPGTDILTGPIIYINNANSQLQYVKIGIVITGIRNILNYPDNIGSEFHYSGVFMNYTLYNQAQPIVLPQRTSGTTYLPSVYPAKDIAAASTTRTDGSQNYNYFSLLRPKYTIFGLSSFFINKLPADISVINFDLTFPAADSVLFNTDNVNYMTGVVISSDQWALRQDKLCTFSSTEMLFINQKLLVTVPPIVNTEQNIYETTSAFQYTYFAGGNTIANIASARSANVLFTNTLFFANIKPGAAYSLRLTLATLTSPAPTVLNGNYNFTFSLTVEGNQILAGTGIVTTTAGPNTALTTTPGTAGAINPIGYIFTSASPAVEIAISMPRGTDYTAADGTMHRYLSSLLVVTEYSVAYDPITDCCVATCPANSGVLPPNNYHPPVCVQCSAGLIYNSVTRSCQCKTGHYSITQNTTNSNMTQCYPCLTPLCLTCNSSTPTLCNTCVPGAAFNNNTSNNLCVCTAGFYQNGSLCNACPVKCQTCVTGAVCLACSDNTTRNFNDSCNCIVGFYDAGVAVCAKCAVLCRTCTSGSNCTSCFEDLNRTLNNGQCVCRTGFYQVVQPNGTLTCQRCDPSCTSCSLLPTQCTDCSAAENRILGYNALGHQVCNCIPGFTPNANGQCVQSNCDADPYCSTCLTVLSTTTCIKCIAATFRTLKLPEQKCICQVGYFDANGICTPCSAGCANCTSATTCQSCVVSAVNQNDGTCKCPDGYFFTTSPIRYCKRCANYTLTCINLLQALTCEPNFVIQGGLCTCPAGRFINGLGQCVPCISGCATCNSSTTCQACNVPLLLQVNSCVSRCGPGFYQNGFVCTRCSQGCVSCNGPNICLICENGLKSYNGFCFLECPSGSVADGNTCVECNSPCATCVDHPSKCLTCKSCCGNLFNFKCLDTCPVGTYSINGACQYCSYICKSCVGSDKTCTSCPDGKILYNGGCYDKCPFVMIGGVCTFNCAKGFYKTEMNECKACDSNCLTCDLNPKNCTTCTPIAGFALNGLCLRNCPNNYLSKNGECIPCHPQCNGCTDTCDNCVNCAPGFYKCGSSCCKTCSPNQFIDFANSMCVSCNPTCKTCSSQQFCTTCLNPQAVPVNGVCNDCSYPCQTCGTAPSQCTSCVPGFNLIGITCIASCPPGAYPKSGVCVCTTGVLYSNQCMAKCPVGYGNIGGQCDKCNENCASCDGVKSECKECINGYALDQVSGVCQKAPSCQFGQYFSQSSNACTRICPVNTYFYENVCLTSCLSGFYDNGVGGCVASTPATGCSYPYYLSNGVCVSNCPSGTYPDTQNRVCQSCSSNCFSCLTNTFCYACNAGYDLNNGVCIAASITCPGQFRYNGVCYIKCPEGTCEQGSYCQRTCPAGTWAYNGGCYRTCPTKYTTTDACVDNCPQGTQLINGVCQAGSQTCPRGQYKDGTTSSCRPCTFPCSECSLAASYCTACTGGMTLNQNMCISNANTCGAGRYRDNNQVCQSCPAKCTDCINGQICSSCSSGYTFNGNDCIKTIAQLKPVVLAIKSVTKRGNTAFITICPNIIPNGLSPQQQNNFFTVVPSQADKANVAYVNQWLSTVDNGCISVGVNYNTFPVQSAVFLAVNAQLLAGTYLSIGYSADAASFVSAAVNINLPATPANVVPPNNAAFSGADIAGTPVVARAVKAAEDIVG